MTSSTAFDHSPPTRLVRSAATHRYQWPLITRRGLQITLGVLWLGDAALQLQPFMFTNGFAREILARSAQGQPGWVGAPVDFFAHIIAAHSAPFDATFALGQLALGVGFLFRRRVRPAIVGSVAWSAGILVVRRRLGRSGLWTCLTGHRRSGRCTPVCRPCPSRVATAR